MKWSWVLALILLAGCATPKGVTPKADVRPVAQTQEKIQASVGKTRTYVTKIKESERKVSDALTRTSNALAKAGDSKYVLAARESLAVAEKQRQESLQYRDWADRELANAWTYGEQAKSQIETLSGQIDASRKHEEEQAKWIEKYEPVIKQVNSWFGLGAFVYGFKKVAGNLLILGAILGVLALVLWGLSFAFPAIAVAFRAVKGVVGRLVNRRK